MKVGEKKKAALLLVTESIEMELFSSEELCAAMPTQAAAATAAAEERRFHQRHQDHPLVPDCEEEPEPEPQVPTQPGKRAKPKPEPPAGEETRHCAAAPHFTEEMEMEMEVSDDVALELVGDTAAHFLFTGARLVFPLLTVSESEQVEVKSDDASVMIPASANKTSRLKWKRLVPQRTGLVVKDVICLPGRQYLARLERAPGCCLSRTPLQAAGRASRLSGSLDMGLCMSSPTMTYRRQNLSGLQARQLWWTENNNNNKAEKQQQQQHRMDRDLLKQCLACHGDSLFNKLRCEQTENPDFQTLVPELCKVTSESTGLEHGGPLVEQFIARKADILFCPTWKTTTPQEEEHEEEDEEAAEPYALMPPLELFMEVSYDERRSMLYRDLERGDMVVGRINNIREYGFFLTLLCMAGGLRRDIEDLELSALCHIREIPSTGNHDDPLSYYQVGDFIRAGVKDIDRYQEKITVSLQPASLSPSLGHIKLGVVTKEELPVHYRRSVRAASDCSETYECILMSCHGYHNPSVVDYLLEKVRISDTHPPSMMRGLQSKLFQPEDFASAIRKKQSASWALKCVRAGVDHFKHGRHVEAMNEYNKALDIDTNNVEALVARGALYANKGGIVKAITDFEQALESCPDHRNAKKYLCQTLVERGKQ
ncbi:hypothetical protein F2P81_005319 [Scophthalmus maximus]|uniref:S1 motif domain-containing protein n=1 Tax=Scophthalmus maximus TaxID=52904 RepID=A0A6A4T654_SCOMX|nr:hypothetical protein F2P81_005319 [Scophthalmus maximus]